MIKNQTEILEIKNLIKRGVCRGGTEGLNHKLDQTEERRTPKRKGRCFLVKEKGGRESKRKSMYENSRLEE